MLYLYGCVGHQQCKTTRIVLGIVGVLSLGAVIEVRNSYNMVAVLGYIIIPLNFLCVVNYLILWLHKDED